MEVIEVARGNQSMVVLGSRWPCPGTATSFTLLRSLVLFFLLLYLMLCYVVAPYTYIYATPLGLL